MAARVELHHGPGPKTQAQDRGQELPRAPSAARLPRFRFPTFQTSGSGIPLVEADIGPAPYIQPELEPEFVYHRDSEELDKVPRGLPGLAAIQNCYYNHSIYRRFGRLFERTLILMQRALVDLELRLTDLDESLGSSTSESRLAVNKPSQEDTDKDTVARDRLHAEIEKKLFQYSDLLLRHKQLQALPQASQRTHERLYKFMQEQDIDSKSQAYILPADDFVSTRIDNVQASAENSFCLKLFQNDQGIVDRSLIVRLLMIGLVLLCGALMLTPVAVLYLVPLSKPLSALVVAAFFFVFILALCRVPEIRFDAVLIGLSAYMAVLVTFLGNMPGNNNSR